MSVDYLVNIGHQMGCERAAKHKTRGKQSFEQGGFPSGTEENSGTNARLFIQIVRADRFLLLSHQMFGMFGFHLKL